MRDAAFAGQPLHLGDAFVRLRAVVTDATGETRETTKQFQVTTRPLRVEIFPESGELVQGVANTLYYFVATYADGSPAQARIVTGGTSVVQTNEVGIGKVSIRPNKNTDRLTISAETEDGARLETIKELRLGETDKGILLRTDRAVYRQGETANLSVLSATATRRVFLDIVKDGRSFATTTIDIEASKGAYAFDLPLDLAGTVQLQAYAILPSGEIARDTKLIQVHRAQQLLVEAKLDAETYKPAEKAMIEFLVKSKSGEPIEAALSLAAVDEAVFALNDMRPGLEEMYFLIQEEILKPRYQFTAQPRADFTQLPEDIDPLVEEANTVAFAGSEGSAEGPTSAEGQTIHQRWDQVHQARRDHGNWLVSLLAIVPGFGLICMFGFFAAYAGTRVRFQPRGLEQKLQVATFRQRMVVMSLILIGSVVLIPMILVTIAWTGMIRSETTFMIIFIVLCLAATVALAVSAGELSRLPHADRHLLLFTKAIKLVPAMFGFASAVIVGMIWAKEIQYGSLSDGMALTLVLICFAAILFSFAFVLFLRGALSRTRTVKQNLLSIGIHIGATLALPFALALVVLPSAGAPNARLMDQVAFAAEGGMMEMEEMAANLAPGASIETGDKDGGSGGTPGQPRVRRSLSGNAALGAGNS